jgi:hypothetical protein
MLWGTGRQCRTGDGLEKIIHQVSAIEHRQRQQVQHADAQAHDGEKADEGDEPLLRRLTCGIGDRQRAVQVAHRGFADHDAAEHLQAQRRHVPGALHPLDQPIDRAVAHQHALRWRTQRRIDAADRACPVAGSARRHRDAERLAAALHLPAHRHAAAVAHGVADALEHLLRLGDALLVDAHDAVGGAQASCCRGPAGTHLAQHRLAVRPRQPDAADRVGIDLAHLDQLELERHCALTAPLDVGDQKLQILAVQRMAHHLPAQLVDRRQVVPPAVAFGVGAHPVARVQAGALERAGCRRRTENRLRLLDADPMRRRIQQHRQQQVGDRAGGHDGRALGQRLAVEGAVLFMRRHRRLALVEHAHVAAERQRSDHELGLAALPAPQRAAEADRETQHLHAACHRDAVVAVLVHHDQQTERDDEGEHRDHAIAFALTCRRATARARSSSASRSSSESCGPKLPAICSSVASLTASIAVNGIAPSRNAATATSLAALSTLVAPGAARKHS